jgi:hypothetical protein
MKNWTFLFIPLLFLFFVMPNQRVLAGFISKEVPKNATTAAKNPTVEKKKAAFEAFTAKKIDFRNKLISKAKSLKELLPAPLQTLRKGKYLSIGITLLVVGLVFELLDGLILKGAGRALGYIGPLFMAVGLIFVVLWFIYA